MKLKLLLNITHSEWALDMSFFMSNFFLEPSFCSIRWRHYYTIAMVAVRKYRRQKQFTDALVAAHAGCSGFVIREVCWSFCSCGLFNSTLLRKPRESGCFLLYIGDQRDAVVYMTIFQLLCTSLISETSFAITSFLTNDQLSEQGCHSVLSAWNVPYNLGSSAGVLGAMLRGTMWHR